MREHENERSNEKSYFTDTEYKNLRPSLIVNFCHILNILLRYTICMPDASMDLSSQIL